MTHQEEQLAWLRLLHGPRLTAAAARAVTGRLGSVAAVLAATPQELAAAGLAPDFASSLRAVRPGQLERDVAWLGGVGRSLLTADSPQYPPLLARLDDAPAALFVEGDATALGEPQIAIVGSRNPTASGRDTAFAFAAELARAGLTITSGLAAGIDTAAHEGALAAGGRTVAVCGTGLDRTYPRANEPLARRIAASGAVVSEFPAGTPPRPMNFPQRNRILSGLALGVLVIEAAQRSGSLITARLAGEQGREVFAVPGSIHNPLARGCHRLIRDGAKLVEDVADVLAELGPLAIAARPHAAAQASDSARDSGRGLDTENEMLLNALGFEPVDVDTLVARTGFTASSVCSMLLILELRGEVESRAGGRYCRHAPGRLG